MQGLSKIKSRNYEAYLKGILAESHHDAVICRWDQEAKELSRLERATVKMKFAVELTGYTKIRDKVRPLDLARFARKNQAVLSRGASVVIAYPDMAKVGMGVYFIVGEKPFANALGSVLGGRVKEL